MTTQTNMNPKGDALMVLEILIRNCPDEQFNKETVVGMILRIAGEPNPQNILKGADYVDYMQNKKRTRTIHGPANTTTMPGG